MSSVLANSRSVDLCFRARTRCRPRTRKQRVMRRIIEHTSQPSWLVSVPQLYLRGCNHTIKVLEQAITFATHSIWARTESSRYHPVIVPRK